MRLLKQAFAVLGALVVLAFIVAFVAPKKAHALAAALVQIVPGSTTHVGQNESNLVSLVCLSPTGFCQAQDSSGNIASSTYQVPSGSTLVITDYEFYATAAAGLNLCDSFAYQGASTSTLLVLGVVPSCAVADKDGFAYGKEHFTTGIRAASGGTIFDVGVSEGRGLADIQGYLVPND
jgi:hypothetical protein